MKKQLRMLKNAQGAESSNKDQAEDVTNAEFVDKKFKNEK